jgi:hypothetical protein
VDLPASRQEPPLRVRAAAELVKNRRLNGMLDAACPGRVFTDYR